MPNMFSALTRSFLACFAILNRRPISHEFLLVTLFLGSVIDDAPHPNDQRILDFLVGCIVE